MSVNDKSSGGVPETEITQAPAPSVITLVLVVVNVAMYLATLLTGAHASPIYNSLKLVPSSLSLTSCWTLIASMFLHVDLGHLMANMFSLYILGGICEQLFGKGRYLLAYFGGGIAGGLVFALLRHGSLTGAVGASGAIFALMGLYGAFLLALKKKVGPDNASVSAPVEQAIRSFAIILVLNAVLVPLLGNIAWEAHLGGFLFGLLIGASTIPNILTEKH